MGSERSKKSELIHIATDHVAEEVFPTLLLCNQFEDPNGACAKLAHGQVASEQTHAMLLNSQVAPAEFVIKAGLWNAKKDSMFPRKSEI